MSKIPIFHSIRLISQEDAYLNRRSGSKGEIFYNKDSDSLTLFNGSQQGGIDIARSDLTNVSDASFLSKASAAGLGNTTVSVSDETPQDAAEGNLWLNTSNNLLYVYVNDQWIVASFSGSYNDLTNKPTLFSGSYDDLTNKPTLFSGSYNDLTNKPTLPTYTAVSGDAFISGNYDFSNNRLLFANVYQEIANLPNPAVYHGMFAHVHATGKAYYSHAGQWKQLADSNDTLNTYNLAQVSATDGQALVWNNANNRWQPGTIDIDIGNFSFVGSTIDTDDSSSIIFTPAVQLQSDLTVDNEINANVISVANINVSGDLTSTGSGTPELSSDNEIIITPGTTTILNGLTTFYQTTEVVDTKTGATGTVDHDFSTGSLFLHTNIAANFTANFTNVPTTNNRSTSVALILDQGGTAYIPNALQIDGAAQTIKWSGGSPPLGTVNYIDIVNFTLIRTNNAWTVVGSLSTYN